jgi:hypothetical protein
MCHICGQPSSFPCNCIQQINLPCNPTPCSQTGVTLLFDASQVLYHKNNNSASLLTCLGLGNGATLQLILETIDTKICQLNVPDWTLTFIRESHVVNTLNQFGVAVDELLSGLQDQISAMGFLGNVTSDPVAVDGQYWFRTDTDQLKIRLNGLVRIITIT